jgi:hypothetical protein
VIAVRARESNKDQGGRGDKRADHLARNRQQKTDIHRPFSTTFLGTVTNRSGVTTITTEKDGADGLSSQHQSLSDLYQSIGGIHG